jgi:hypothetical protein
LLVRVVVRVEEVHQAVHSLRHVLLVLQRSRVLLIAQSAARRRTSARE